MLTSVDRLLSLSLSLCVCVCVCVYAHVAYLWSFYGPLILFVKVELKHFHVQKTFLL